MIRLKFNSTENRDAFANRFNLESKVDTTELDVDWHLLQFAKLDDNCTDYEEVAVLRAAPGANSEREFIVKGNPETFGVHGTVSKDLGNGFYLVKSTVGTTLSDHVDSIEHTSAPVTFMANASTMTSLNGDSTTDVSSITAQWARLRVASRYRPFAKTFVKHDTNYLSKPELIIMDSGINFDHPELADPSIEKENFYTLSAFNGSFADDIGHGTGVASMACGKNLGIASNVKLLNCKIGGASYHANLVDLGDAIDAIVARASANPTITRIVNMSWGIARSAWLDAKVQSLLDMGITVVCAAGNNGIDVADISPAGLSSVITVAASDKFDIPAGFNNISPSDSGVTTGSGLSLDIFAPGDQVTVADGVSGGYKISSGTSFSAPLVAGVAAEIASLYSTIVVYDELKNIVLGTATNNALLFENDKYSENQNKVAYLITADVNAKFAATNSTMYLGVPEKDRPLVVDLNSSIGTVIPSVFPDDPIVWSLEWTDPALEATYSKFMTLNSVTGMLTITEPDVTLPEETKLKMVDFKGVATTSRIKAVTPTLFYFQSNPLYKDTQQTDITLALTDTNSISFYGGWGFSIK